jgi:heme exporter protein D
MNDFLQMGGYAVYVWTSYGLTLLVLGLNFILPRAREKKLIGRLSRRIRSGSNQVNESKAT